MKSNIYISVFLVFITLFCSCQSTRVYIKNTEQFYDDDVLLEEKSSVTRYDYKDEECKEFQKQEDVEKLTKRYFDFSDDYILKESKNGKTVLHLFTGESKKSSKKSYTELNFSLIEAEVDKRKNDVKMKVIGQKKSRLKDGEISKCKGDKFSDEDEELFKSIFDKAKDIVLNNEEVEFSDKVQMKTYSEKVKVISQPNGGYITYSILGKPFVILGASCWNILKCVGYAFINFGGGYNLVKGKSSESSKIWYLPSYKDSKEKSDLAKEKASIKVYPEYHLPFTDNHIEVDKYDRKVQIETFVGQNSEKIDSIEHFEFDNKMSVNLSAKADAASTSAMAGLIGTAVTIPISLTSWVLGLVCGAWPTN